MVLLAIENVSDRDGVTEQDDLEDPDGAIADIKTLAIQYGRNIDSVNHTSIDRE